MVTPAQRRSGAVHLMQHLGVSERRASRISGLSRSALRYRPRPRNDKALRVRLRRLAEQYPRYGYLLLHGLLKAEGLVVNRKRTYRLYTELVSSGSHQAT